MSLLLVARTSTDKVTILVSATTWILATTRNCMSLHKWSGEEGATVGKKKVITIVLLYCIYYGLGYSLILTHDLTSACNLRCVFCTRVIKYSSHRQIISVYTTSQGPYKFFWGIVSDMKGRLQLNSRCRCRLAHLWICLLLM